MATKTGKKKESGTAKASGKTAASGTRKKSTKKASDHDTPATDAQRLKVQEEMRKHQARKRLQDVISGLIYIAIGLFIFVSVQYRAAGEFGNQLGIILKGMFGIIGLVVPWYLIALGLLFITGKALHFTQRSLWITFIILILICVLNAGRFYIGLKSEIPLDIVQFYKTGVNLESGGAIGMTIASPLVKFLGVAGLYIFASALLLICLLLLLNSPLAEFFRKRSQRREEERRLDELMRQSIADQSYQQEMERRAKEATLTIQSPENLTGKPSKPVISTSADASRQQEMDLSRDSMPEIKHGILSSLLKSEQTEARRERALNTKKPSNVVDMMKLNPLDKNKTQEISSLEETELKPDAKRPEPKINLGIAQSGMAKVLGSDFDESDPILHREPSGSFGLEPVSSPREGYGLYGAGSSGNNAGVMKSAEDLMREEQELREAEKGRNKPDADSASDDADLAVAGLAGAAAGGAAGMVASEKPRNSKPVSTAQTDMSGLAVASAASDNVLKKTTYIYRKPPLDLLKMPELPSTKGLNQQLRDKARVLEHTLESFNVDAHVIQVTQGPAVTRYEIQPGPGVKVNKIVGLTDDIALNLRAKSIRMEAPIPGKAAVGIEVENEHVQMVRIRELIGSKAFRDAKSRISFVVGKDIAGNAIVADLKGMPHLLIAGATGSGKSVCINSIITSLLYKASPDEVKLVLIDPKVVELGNYNGIPHLLIPVVTDPSKAAAALNWAVAEMTDRYKKFANENVRDLKTYNEKMVHEERGDEKMPQIVIIIDELADLMMAAPNQVEESICRLAQLARAAGMHLIVATQRPSVDIITGLIKANIPSRIAFAVSSQFDSRTILDMNGAEKLVGKGDMLFSPQGAGKPIRVQGTFISDEEINNVIDFVKEQTPEEETAYNENVIHDIEQKSIPGADDTTDELLLDAISCVVHAGKASTSMLQRNFRIGYNRAARIMDEMEERGIIGPQDGSHPRQVLMTEDELEQLPENVN